MKRSHRIIITFLVLTGFVYAQSFANAQVDSTELLEGCYLNNQAAFDGYTLITHYMSSKTSLINNCGEVVHQWKSQHLSKTTNFLSKDGRLFKSAVSPKLSSIRLQGKGGIIEVLNWNSEVLWSYDFTTLTETINHDFELLPNGHLLVIFAEYLDGKTSYQLGREAKRDTYATVVKEIEMVGKNDMKVVWEWKVADHLIQELNKNQANYGILKEHPERVNINYKLHRATGLLIPIEWDLFHANSIDYNAELDQILLTIKHFGEIWVIDHSTTTEEAKGSIGGISGKGGDLLYRYGNPTAYNAGSPKDRLLFAPHDAQWIKKGSKSKKDPHFISI